MKYLIYITVLFSSFSHAEFIRNGFVFLDTDTNSEILQLSISAGGDGSEQFPDHNDNTQLDGTFEDLLFNYLDITYPGAAFGFIDEGMPCDEEYKTIPCYQEGSILGAIGPLVHIIKRALY